jgi:hypothetical protein
MRILFGIPIAAVLLATLCPSAAVAWGAGGGGASVPAFGALWQGPSASQQMKKSPNGGSVHRGWSKAKKKKDYRSSNVSR